MSRIIKLETEKLKALHSVDPALASYNVEMAEITGGTFWKAYSPEIIAGKEKFPPISGMHEIPKLMQWYPPIDTTNPRLIKLAKALGPMWVRVSGTWATKTYYDFEGKGEAPEGWQNRLTKEQWLNLLDFVDAVNGKLLISVANCQGLHNAEEPWNPSQAEQIFRLSKEHGHPIDAVEFTNEPNMLEGTGFPKGYTVEHFRRDQDLFHKWVRDNYPNTLIVGPCTTDPAVLRNKPADIKGEKLSEAKGGAGIADVMDSCSTDSLLEGCTEKLDVFSYHYYNGISERLESVMPDGHWQAEEAHTDAFLSVAGSIARGFAPYRDKYVPGGQMWVTESGDAAAGGDTWAPTYLEVLRTLNELGDFAYVTDGIIFHNTLAASDYGWLKHGTFDPRPSYFSVWVWNQLMGTTVYECNNPASEGAHMYCHSRRDGKDGYVYLIINNSLTNTTTVELPKEAVKYTLDGNGNMRNTVMYLNGKPLTLGENDELPECIGEAVSGTVELAPGSCTFFVI